MYFYIFLFLIGFFLTLLEGQVPQARRKHYAKVMIIILACVSGFRYLGGSDIELYEDGYNRVPLLFTSDFLDSIGSLDFHFWEPGFMFYMSFCKTLLGLSFYGFLVVTATFFYTCLYIGWKRYSLHWGLLLMFFMYKLFFYETFVAMRQQMSICLFFLIMHLVEERKPLKYYILCTFIVLPFHYGGAILLLVYFLNNVKLTKKGFLILGLVMLPFAFLPPVFSQILNPIMTLISADKAEGYLSGEEVQSIMYTLETYLVWIMIYLNYNRIVNHISHGEYMIKLFLIILPCVTIFRDVVILRREMDYFYLCVPILLGYISNVNKRLRNVLILGTAMICFYGYIRYISNFDGGKALVPYVSWLELPNASFFMK